MTEPPERRAPAGAPRAKEAASARPPRPPREPRPAKPTGPDPDEDTSSPVRAFVVVVLVLIIGGGFLAIGFDDQGSNDSGIELGITDDESSSDTTVPGAGEATGPDVATVPVYVANGTGVAERGAAVTEQLRSAGYTMTVDPGDAPVTGATAVYFSPEQEAAAQGVATTLGLGADRVVAWPEPPPFEAPFGPTVFVHLGSDLAA
jgi:hypothetical protein